MRSVNIFLYLIVVLLVIGFLTNCDKTKKFNGTMVDECQHIRQRLEHIFRRQLPDYYHLDKTTVQDLEDLKEEIVESIDKVDALESDGSDEAEALRDAFLDLFEYYESSADGVLRQVAQHYDQKPEDRFYSEKEIHTMLRRFYQKEREFHHEIGRAQKAYGKKLGRQLEKIETGSSSKSPEPWQKGPRKKFN